MGARRVWPREGITRIPYWIYSDPEVYAREQERPVVVVCDRDGSVNVVENRCAHGGVQFCQRHLGNASGRLRLDPDM